MVFKSSENYSNSLSEGNRPLVESGWISVGFQYIVRKWQL